MGISIGIQTEETANTFWFNDQQNLLWFFCPFCTAAFPNDEHKLIQHKKKAHGLGVSNRRALIISQAELEPCSKAAPLKTDHVKTKRCCETETVADDWNNRIFDQPKETASVDVTCDNPVSVQYNPNLDVSVKSEAEEFEFDSTEAFVPSPIIFASLLTELDDEGDRSSDSELPSVQESLNYFQNLTKSVGNILAPSNLTRPLKPKKKIKAKQKTRKPYNIKLKKAKPKPKYVPCSYCFQSFSTAVDRSTHLKFHKTEENPYRCKFCPFRFVTRRNREQHVYKNHEPKPKSFVCEQCGKAFSLSSQLTRHLKTHGPKNFTCADCNCIFIKANTYAVHRQAHCTDNSVKNTDCNICNTHFNDVAELGIHLKTHEKIRANPCSKCGKSFASKRTLRNHDKIRHLGIDNRKFICCECGQKCGSETLLKIHSAKHKDDKPFTCDICGKGFKYKYYLILHHNRHEGLKKYKCDQCDKSYTDRPHLIHHLASCHWTVEPEFNFVCSVCGKRFQFEVHCRGHEIREHFKREQMKAKKVPCRYCDLMFRSNCMRNKHERVHIRGKLKPGPKPGKAREKKLQLQSLETAANAAPEIGVNLAESLP